MDIKGLSKFLKKVEEEEMPDDNHLGYLKQLNVNYGTMYAGTADPIAIAKRRSRNKMARQSRRRNRK